MPKFRKKPVEIEAMQLAGASSAAEIVAWAEGHGVAIESFLDEDDWQIVNFPHKLLRERGLTAIAMAASDRIQRQRFDRISQAARA